MSAPVAFRPDLGGEPDRHHGPLNYDLWEYKTADGAVVAVLMRACEEADHAQGWTADLVDPHEVLSTRPPHLPIAAVRALVEERLRGRGFDVQDRAAQQGGGGA